jgi:hypothetical protein
MSVTNLHQRAPAVEPGFSFLKDHFSGATAMPNSHAGGPVD